MKVLYAPLPYIRSLVGITSFSNTLQMQLSALNSPHPPPPASQLDPFFSRLLSVRDAPLVCLSAPTRYEERPPFCCTHQARLGSPLSPESFLYNDTGFSRKAFLRGYPVRWPPVYFLPASGSPPPPNRARSCFFSAPSKPTSFAPGRDASQYKNKALAPMVIPFFVTPAWFEAHPETVCPF